MKAGKLGIDSIFNYMSLKNIIKISFLSNKIYNYKKRICVVNKYNKIYVVDKYKKEIVDIITKYLNILHTNEIHNFISMKYLKRLHLSSVTIKENLFNNTLRELYLDNTIIDNFICKNDFDLISIYNSIIKDFNFKTKKLILYNCQFDENIFKGSFYKLHLVNLKIIGFCFDNLQVKKLKLINCVTDIKGTYEKVSLINCKVIDLQNIITENLKLTKTYPYNLASYYDSLYMRNTNLNPYFLENTKVNNFYYINEEHIGSGIKMIYMPYVSFNLLDLSYTNFKGCNLKNIKTKSLITKGCNIIEDFISGEFDMLDLSYTQVSGSFLKNTKVKHLILNNCKYLDDNLIKGHFESIDLSYSNISKKCLKNIYTKKLNIKGCYNIEKKIESNCVIYNDLEFI